MPLIRFKSVIERVDGRNKARMTNPNRYSAFMASLKPGDTIWWDAITKKPKRSDQQNRYYFMYLSVIAEETGDNEKALHEFLKRELLPPRFLRVLGRVVKVPSSTTELSKASMSDYLDKIAALTGIPLPNIEEAGFLRN